MQYPIFSKSRIHTILTVTPKKRVTLLDFANIFGEKEISKIGKVTGIDSVTVAEEGKTASDYCCEAAKMLMEEIGITGGDIDGIVYVNETPDHIIPSTAPTLQDRLGVAKNTINIDLRCSCPGFVYGLFQSSMLIECGFCNNVLLMVGNTSSRLVNPEDRALLMVTGDAASAALVTRSDKSFLSTFSFFVDGGKFKSIYVPAGGSRMPIKKGVTDVVEYDADHNGHSLENLKMDGLDVMVFAISEGRNLCRNVMTRMGWSADDVDLFALHQANEMMVTRIAKGLKADMKKVPISVRETGNCGLVSIPLTLCNSFNGVNPQLKKVVACGYGSGLIAAAGAFDLSQTNIVRTREVQLCD